MDGFKICNLLSLTNEGLNGYQVSVWEDEKVLAMDDGDGCITM